MKRALVAMAALLIAACGASVPEERPTETAVTTVPINPSADSSARKLLVYLGSQFGKTILSGQQDLTWQDSVDMAERVYRITGKYPAVMGYDLMNYHRGDIDGGSGLQQVEEAVDWWNRGGIVTFCWHWRDPSRKTGAFYTRETDFRINLSDSLVRSQLVADIDRVAGDLKRLQEAGVPVLWRPLHEASGEWFWWGASGPQAYIDLWRLMVDRMANHHGLNNLIWVYNAQNPDWYPGDDYVDIVGEDVYAEVRGDTLPDYGSQIARFQGAERTPAQSKIVALTETGIIPHPDSAFADGATWSWFCVWNDGPDLANPRNFFSGTYFNSHDHKRMVYNHPRVLTLEDVAARPR